MTLSVDLVRARRRRRLRGQPLRRLRTAAAVWAAALVVAAGAAGTVAAFAFDDLTRDLPEVGEIEGSFDLGSGAYLPTRYFDRSGQSLLSESVPSEPVTLEAAAETPGLEALLRATVAYYDPGFWDEDESGSLSPWAAGVWRGPAEAIRPGIAEQLIRQTILPAGEHRRSGIAQSLRMAFLAADLRRAYPNEQILEWYLNSAYYGHGAYGPAAAARTYFNRDLSDLNLAQAAMLAAIPASPDLNPIDAPQQAKARQADVLHAMDDQGVAGSGEIERALAAPLRLDPAASEPAGPAAEFLARASRQVADLLGPDFASRGGLRVITSLDLDLQLQAECTAASQAVRLSGGLPGTILPARDGSPCTAALLLAPLRPGDSGIDRGLDALAVVVLDPETGEVLSLVSLGRSDGAWEDTAQGVASQIPRRAGPTLYPFIYLTAFATGYSPGGMVLDIPTTVVDPVDGETYVPEDPDGQTRGPIRFRTALANTLPVPAARTLELLGAGSVLRTAHQMGLGGLEPPPAAGVRWVMEEGRSTLLDLVQAYGVVAARGTMAGSVSGGSSGASTEIDPTLVLRVEDARGSVLYAGERTERAVLSPQLAFLLADVMSDEPARRESLGHPNVLEIGRPAGVVTGTASGDADAWAVGFTPSRVVGVWMGTLEEEPVEGLSPVSALGPVWSAVLQYASGQSAPEGWGMPPGISVVEVCDPSGMLPTVYCPNAVRELFIQGTEPTHYDTLYQPFRVNRETGKLATLFTPLDLVEERVYLVPPPEAAAWAEAAGIEQPPREYDTITAQAGDPRVSITAPAPFTVVRGEVRIEGSAIPEGFTSYRLQYGQGLNPTRWVQIGVDEERSVEQGRLGQWDTAGLSGLYTLQLLVVREEGRVATAAVPVTIDNTAPIVTLLSPEGGAELQVDPGSAVVVEVAVADNLGIERVEIFVDRRIVATLTEGPYSIRWTPAAAGEHTLSARAYDQAGNFAEGEPVTVTVRR